MVWLWGSGSICMPEYSRYFRFLKLRCKDHMSLEWRFFTAACDFVSFEIFILSLSPREVGKWQPTPGFSRVWRSPWTAEPGRLGPGVAESGARSSDCSSPFLHWVCCLLWGPPVLLWLVLSWTQSARKILVESDPFFLVYLCPFCG